MADAFAELHFTEDLSQLAPAIQENAAKIARSVGAAVDSLSRDFNKIGTTPDLTSEFPALAARYRATYARGHYASDAYRRGLHEYVVRLCERHGLRVRDYDRRGSTPRRAGVPEQLSLELQ